MNKNLQTVYNYHNETKHSHIRYARSLGYMDWATQPDPYRTYIDAKQTSLPLAFEHDTLHYNEIFEEEVNVIAPFCIESISQFFQYSLGLAAVKQNGEQSWALRCNASSGNLQPTEAYIICQNLNKIQNGIHHYCVKDHSLELIADAKKNLNINDDSFLIAMSSIVWREAWKYGERSYRYTQLDCGHAYRALQISAYMLGWKITKVDASEDELSSLLGFDQKNRFISQEVENVDMLLNISKNKNENEIDLQYLRKCFNETYTTKANQLSSSWHDWQILSEIQDATKIQKIKIPKQHVKYNIKRQKSYESKEIVLKRRSAQIMNEHDSSITFHEFETLIASVSKTLDEKEVAINLVFFIHNVQDMNAGLYILLRDQKYLAELKKEFKDQFIWEAIKNNAGLLYLLKEDDYTSLSKTISCNQDIASNGAFSLGMLADFSNQLNLYGAYRYKELYWECGAIGQQLYLEATSLKLSATGIGCYLDDIFHEHLGIKNMSHQSLYHFTVGRALIDNRLTSIQPYQNRILYKNYSK